MSVKECKGQTKTMSSSSTSLFDREDDTSRSGSSNVTFPTEPAFVVPVEVKPMPDELYGEGHCGVVALSRIPKHTNFWVWTDRVHGIHHTQLEQYLEEQSISISTEKDLEDDAKLQARRRLILRQGFVLPNDDDHPNRDEYFCSNPTDAGRFMSHSNNPNCGPNGTIRDVQAGEELMMDYSFHGNPQWYQDICYKYAVLTETQVATQQAAAEQQQQKKKLNNNSNSRHDQSATSKGPCDNFL